MKLIKKLSLVSLVLFLNQFSSIGSVIGNAYYALLLVIFLLLIFVGSSLKPNILMLFFLIAGFLSIIFNDIPSFFQPYQRFGIFIILMGLIGPLFHNSALHAFKLYLGNFLNNAILIMVSLSFIGIVIGLPIMVGRGGFTGLFIHSMILGLMAAIAILVALHKAHITQYKNRYWFFMSLAVIAFVTCITAGSRSALLAGIAGSIFFYYKLNQKRISGFVKTMFVIVGLGILSFPIWEPYTERLMEKVAYGEAQGDALATRSALWEMRVSEFEASPIVGVGFASVDTKINTKFDEEGGQVEPGSSWLAILSMTGLLGFIPILILVIKNIFFVFKDQKDPAKSALLGGMLFLFIVHMLAEGYALSAGSGLFFLFWLTMGTIELYKKNNHIINEKG
jgi:O-antigen ligase